MQRRVVIVIYEGFQLLDLAGPSDVFTTATLLTGDDGYTVHVAAPRAGEVTARGGVTVTARTALADVPTPIDTLMIVGGLGIESHLTDPDLTPHVTRLASASRRVTSVCSGAFLLAETGLLTGRRCTTHWLVADQLATRYPDVEVDPDPIYVKDGHTWTSAGVTAGIDLSLALVAEDHGHRLARDVASGLVVYLHRPGGQSQFSTPLHATTPPAEHLRDLQAYIDANPAADLSVPTLARRAGMSDRHFSRVFTQQTGIPPGRYVERSRADAARRLLETTTHPLPTIARTTGLGAPETLYRVFRRHWRTSPGDYRRRFQSKEP
ncbi:GlxA family transcriptional regulator [Sphaerisporangium rubeum]|uniref:Transcriptional regulator GlxA family with amidase domain n=1 Tax=Sphaerisporangium rubeum TaxID=321317 RepID=A0A7X0IGY9_9ACTN|nr:GlxA family transcriptional regulator [Sphaerisporangium rubeum]MBB6474982.1 transcriptional regulator GlxA family with amidase domain [Sphaerisporangium rubeum]